MKKLSIDNPFFRFMGKLGDIIILNILYIVTCIPIITIGMATTALYKVMLKCAAGSSNYVVREYIAACKEEWKKSTATWILFLVTGGILLFDVLYIGKQWSALGVGIGSLMIIWALLFSYVFPLQAQFENTVKNTLKNALYLAIRNLPYTIVILAINCIPLVCILMGNPLMGLMFPLYLAAGFAVAARVNATLFKKIFRPFLQTEQSGKEEEDYGNQYE